MKTGRNPKGKDRLPTFHFSGAGKLLVSGSVRIIHLETDEWPGSSPNLDSCQKGCQPALGFQESSFWEREIADLNESL